MRTRSNPCAPQRWKRLSDELPDAEVKEMLTSFLMVTHFLLVGLDCLICAKQGVLEFKDTQLP
jgi:hypothetical protein